LAPIFPLAKLEHFHKFPRTDVTPHQKARIKGSGAGIPSFFEKENLSKRKFFKRVFSFKRKQAYKLN